MTFAMPADLAAPFTLLVLAGTFVVFVRERVPPEATALGALTVLLATGILTPEEALSAMANPAPLTIACMFVLSGALVRVGLIEAASDALTRRAAERPLITLLGFAAMVIAASAIMNNTPIVVMLIPVTLRLAQALSISGSKLLIPLSYCAILGGVCTLIGTSTNLIVDGVARGQGLAPFTLLEITPLGLTVAAVGLVYLLLFGRLLLPDRDTPGRGLGRDKALRFMTEVVIPEGSAAIGRRLAEVDVFGREGVTVIDVLRGDDSLREALDAVVLREGDRVMLRSRVTELIHLQRDRGLKTVDRIAQKNAVAAEVLVAPGCTLAGRSLGRLRLRRRYGIYPLAVHRRTPIRQSRLADVTLRMGDTLILEGDPEDIRRLAEDVDAIVLSRRMQRPHRTERAPVAGVVLLAVAVSSAAGLVPIATAAVAGAAAVIALRCIDFDEALAAVDKRLIALILAMLGVGAALEKTGALELASAAAAPWLGGFSPWLLLLAVIAATSLLTEMVTNNAVAVVMTPLAIALAQGAGVDPRPFVVGVMMAASSAFATPIGYQTNTLVYAPGGYRFVDYLRVGGPLNVLVALVCAAVIPFLWPF